MSKLHIALILGGQSTEHEISIRSAKSIDQAIDKTKYQISYIGITKTGFWLTGSDLDEVITKLNEPLGGHQVFLSIQNNRPVLVEIGSTLSPTPLDIAFPILHGSFGEDGKIQGLFEMNHLSFVGCGVDASVLGIDKAVQKTLLKSAGVPVVDYYSFTKYDWQKDQANVLKSIQNAIKSDLLIVKPARLGSSVGISKTRSAAELIEAINEALKLDDKVIVELCLDHPREIELAILGNEDPTVSVCGEIITTHDFYSYDAKYHDESSKTIIPADLPLGISQKLQDLALQVYKTLGAKGLSRIDFFIDKTDQFWFNEINTMPGFTSISMYPKLIEYGKITFTDLIDHLIQLGLKSKSS